MWGKHHSLVAKRKIGKASKGRNIGRHPSMAERKRISVSLTGKKFSAERKKQISLTTKRGMENPIIRNKISIAMRGRHLSKIHKQRISEGHPDMWGKNNPMFGLKGSKILKKIWQNPEFQKRMAKATNIRPNKDEKQIDEILHRNFPNTFKYVGNFEYFIDGKCPDFIEVKDKNKVIEYWGRSLIFHPNKDKRKTRFYNSYGVKVLNLYRTDLISKNQKKLIAKINYT